MTDRSQQTLQSSAAHELVEAAAVAAPDSGSCHQLTLEVDGVDAMCTELTGRGMTWLRGPIDRPWWVRTAGSKDPAGHIWEIAR